MGHKKIDFGTKTGGFPMTQASLKYMQESYEEALSALSSVMGDNVIVSGMEVVGTNVAAGWVYIGGELLPFAGGTIDTYLHIETTDESLTYIDGISHDVKHKKVAKFGTGAGQVKWADMVRLETLKKNQDKIYAGSELVSTNKNVNEELYLILHNQNILSNYVLIGSIQKLTAGYILWNIYDKGNDFFNISIKTFSGNNFTDDFYFNYMIIKL